MPLNNERINSVHLELKKSLLNGKLRKKQHLSPVVTKKSCDKMRV